MSVLMVKFYCADDCCLLGMSCFSTELLEMAQTLSLSG